MCNDIKKRVTMVKRFVKLAEVCRDLRNFSTLMAVLAGLNNSAVRRLKLTWQVRPFIFSHANDSHSLGC
jgi:hypothetical protein